MTNHTPTGTWEAPQTPPPEATPPLLPPPHAGAWSIAETIAAISRPLPEKMLSNKKMGSSSKFGMFILNRQKCGDVSGLGLPNYSNYV